MKTLGHVCDNFVPRKGPTTLSGCVSIFDPSPSAKGAFEDFQFLRTWGFSGVTISSIFHPHPFGFALVSAMLHKQRIYVKVRSSSNQMMLCVGVSSFRKRLKWNSKRDNSKKLLACHHSLVHPGAQSQWFRMRWGYCSAYEMCNTHLRYTLGAELKFWP